MSLVVVTIVVAGFGGAASDVGWGADAKPVVAWEFNTPADGAQWHANAHLLNPACADGVLSADASGTDPYWSWRGDPFATSPFQYVTIRMRSDKPGSCQLYWTGQTGGVHGGFSARKNTTFNIEGANEWEDVTFCPFWHAEGAIRQLRFDTHRDAHVEVDWIRVFDWSGTAEPATDTYAWSSPDSLEAWRVLPGTAERVSPPLKIDVSTRGWVTVCVTAAEGGQGTLIWAAQSVNDLQRQEFAFQPGENRVCNIDMQNTASWTGDISLLGVTLQESARPTVESVVIGEHPQGPADLDLIHFGFENALNRAGRPCRVMMKLTNRGGESSPECKVTLDTPEGLTLVECTAAQPFPALTPGEQAEAVWTVQAATAGIFPVRLTCSADDLLAPLEIALEFAMPVAIQKLDYVPEPQPIETDVELLAYYFPGWEMDRKWDCVRYKYPIRKPLLGYYDEANPEIVDWQIKWAAENGISCFLVDWYWTKGNLHLNHWFEAYWKSRYRDHLKVAIMWANHNAPGSHSLEDWRAVTREWIDKYFSMDTYYRVDGKPAVYMWAPYNLRRDLDSSEAVRDMLAESQETARAAGLEGISYVALGYDTSDASLRLLESEGYCGFTTYHEWGNATKMSDNPRLARFEDVAATASVAWEEREAVAGDLTYFPVIDTGWDSRPWHGNRALVIEGRTPELFEDLLRNAKAHAAKHGKQSLVFAPVNEWGEGSYIEPCTEYGFKMYEAIRRVFGKGDPATWPSNIAPQDVGLGPYEFPRNETRSLWTFDGGLGGWRSFMAVTDLRHDDNALRCTTTSNDPALTVRTVGLRASEYRRLTVRMQLTGAVTPGTHGQMFWTDIKNKTNEAASVAFPLETDGKMHEYAVDLATKAKWRGDITSFRFDPCANADVDIRIDEIRLVE
ncbi:MAG: hypothetical protein GY851_26775 [bacterium]|nr:hypothetical protein [bacterium]